MSIFWNQEPFAQVTGRRRMLVACLVAACAFSTADVLAKDRLVDACEARQWEEASELINLDSVKTTQADGMTALHWAAFHEAGAIAQQLIDAGADVNAKTAYSITPLSIACERDNAQMVELLLNAGADVNDKLPGGRTMLMLAARTGNVGSVQHLLRAGADVNATETRGQTALMWAAAEDHVDVVDALLDAGADVNETAKSGFTAIFFASRNGSLRSAIRLLDAGVDVNDVIKPKSTSGRNPRARMSALMFGVESAHYELALELVRRGADPNDQRSGYAPLHALSWVRRARKGDGVDGDPEPQGSGSVTCLRFVRELVALGADVNLQLDRGRGGKAQLTHKGCTPFLLAAKTADIPYMKTLLEVGADPTLTNVDNCTALLAASGIGVKSLVDEDPGTEPEVIAAVEFLLGLGLDINHVDSNGETAMHGAAYRNYPLEVRFLFERGADPVVWNRDNVHGWTPREIAGGKRPGAFKPSPVTVEAIDDVLSK